MKIKYALRVLRIILWRKIICLITSVRIKYLIKLQNFKRVSNPSIKFLFKIQCVTDSQSFVEQEDGEPITLDYLPDVAMEKIKAIREIVLEREKTINKMLDFYLKL